MAGLVSPNADEVVTIKVALPLCAVIGGTRVTDVVVVSQDATSDQEVGMPGVVNRTKISSEEGLNEI
jgi:hypothetical protein